MAQTKLLNILSSVSAQIGDPGNETYTQSDVLAAVNLARGKVYDEHMLRLCGAEGLARGETSVFTEIYPEWVTDSSLNISNVTGTTVLTITTTRPHRLAALQLITISGVTGFGSNPNADFTVSASGLTENQFQITHTVTSGSYSTGGKVVTRLANNEILKPIDCKLLISGILNSSSPAITNGLIKVLKAEAFHEAKYNTYSPFAAANDALKMYLKSNSIEVIGGPGVSITGNVQFIYLASPVDAVVNVAYNDIVDPVDWRIDIIDLASEILMSYELE